MRTSILVTIGLIIFLSGIPFTFDISQGQGAALGALFGFIAWFIPFVIGKTILKQKS